MNAILAGCERSTHGGRRDHALDKALARSERIHHARSVPAVNPLRGSCAALRSFG